MPFLRTAHISIEVATAMKRLVVIGKFLYNKETCKVVYIQIAPQFVRVFASIDQGIDTVHLIAKELLLHVRKHLRRFIGEDDTLTVSFSDLDMRVGIVIIYLNEPPAGDGVGVCAEVGLLGDIHSVFVNTYEFGEEIDTHIISV